MKKQNLLVIAIVAIALTIGLLALKPVEEKGILTMRVSEGYSGLYDNSINIVDEAGTVEKIELKPLKAGNLALNQIAINQQLNKIQSKGYKLSFVSEGAGDANVIRTYTFMKE